MINQTTIGNIATQEIGNRLADRVFIEWYETDKKLLYKVSESGEEIGIRVDEHLHDGDILFADSKRVVYISILPSDLICVHPGSMQKMGRLCFELGNRHLPISIGEDEVKVPYDEPTFAYLEKLGFAPQKVTEVFSSHTACHSHQHSHELG